MEFSLDVGDGLAIVVSVVAAGLAWGVSNRQNSLQKRVVELEESRERARLLDEKRASLVASLRPKSQGAALVVENQGKAAANNVRIFVDSQRIGTHPDFFGKLGSVDTIGPGAPADFRMISHDHMKEVYHVELYWDDATGSRGNWESHLTLRH